MINSDTGRQCEITPATLSSFSQFKLQASALALCLATMTPVLAQVTNLESASDGLAEKGTFLQEVIVTGATSKEKSAFETSYAVTTISGEDLYKIAPVGIAELLQGTPGIFVHTSGGEVGNNIFSRGLPASNYRYLPLLEDGLPVWEEGAGAFSNADVFHRWDLTIASAQVVRGGSASIRASNAPGGVTNILTKRGTEEFQGVAKVESGEASHYRGDFHVSGPITDKLLFHAGGFFRSNDGLRNPGFTANHGGQARAGLTYLMDDGEIYMGYRKLDDHVTFYTPIPLASVSKGLPGLDAGRGSLLSNSFATLTVPDGAGDFTKGVDLRDGVHSDIDTFTLLFDKDLSDTISISNKTRRTTGIVDFTSVFSGSINNAQTFLDDALTTLQAADPNTVSASYRDVNGGLLAVSDIGNGLAVRQGLWNTFIDVDNIINDLSATFETGRNTLTVGYYYSHFDQRQQWNWNDVLGEAIHQPRLLDIVGQDAMGNTTISLTNNGVIGLHSNLQDFRDDVTVNAFYVTDSLDITDSLTLEAGLRYHRVDKSGSIAQTTTIDLGDPSTVADDSVSVFTGQATPYEFKGSEWAFSVGANYFFSDHISAFARYSNSFGYTPEFQQWFNCCTDVDDDIDLLEGGVKYQSRSLSAFVTLFKNKFPNIVFANQLPNGTLESANAAAESYGVEVEVMYSPVEFFDLHVGAALQTIEYVNFEGTDPNGEPFDFNGNQINGQPEVQLSVRPVVHLWNGRLDIYSNILHTGKRFSDTANTIELPEFTEVQIGAVAYLTDSLRAQIVVNNVFDEVGITEGNPRAGAIFGATEATFVGRPIFGRNARFSLTYDF